MDNNLIIYGDIHGCYNEFISLRRKLDPKKDDIEICVGDIITKGKDSIQILKYLQKHNIKSVLGNHEDKLVRYLEHQSFDKKNPISLDEDERNIIRNLDKKDIEFLKSLPLFLKYENITILHGGLQNHLNLNDITKKEKSKILRMRYIDTENNYIAYGKEDNTSIFWADLYDGNQGFIVYGHQWFKEAKINKNAIGIDTGCIYGNKLSAVVFKNSDVDNFKIQSVKAENGK